MKSAKDEGKPMDPLFPRLHIDDANRGGPRPPPRNKMALCEPYDLPSTTSKLFSPGVLPLSTNTARHRFVTQRSTSTIGSSKHKLVFPTFSNVAGSRSYHPDPTNVKISATNTKASQPLNCQVQRASSSIMPKVIECNSSQPDDIITSNITRPGDDNVHKKPHFIQHHPDKEICPVVPNGELHKSCSNEQNDVSSIFRAAYTHDEKPDVSQIGEKVSKDAALQLQCVKHQEQGRLFEENKNDTDDTRRIPDRIVRKRCYSALDDIPHSYPLLEDNDRLIKNEAVIERSGVEELDPKRVSEDEIGQGNHDTSDGESIPGLGLTPNDVVGVIGQKLFLKARKMIEHQQHVFAVQIFELHRLLKVQELIAGSVESQKNNSNLNKPYIKFPPINKLLYVTPLDQSSPVATKSKSGTLKPNTGRDPCKDSKCKQPQPPPINNIEGYDCQQSTPKPLLLHSLPADQWLVPVSSTSEGLVYKPCTGPCPPAFGVMAPIYGNCGPIHMSSLVGPRSYGVPAPNHPRVGRLPFDQSYFQPCAIPLLNSSCPSVEIEQSSGVVLESEENNTASPPEKLAGEELSLFPTTPSVKVHKDQEKEQTVQVIKVIPHNPRSATESAARIFQSIQEERKVI